MFRNSPSFWSEGGGVSKPLPFGPKPGGGWWGLETTPFWARKGEGGVLKPSPFLLAKKGGGSAPEGDLERQ